MKKLIALLLVLTMALSVVACSPNSGSGTGENSGSNGTQQGGTNQTPNTPENPDTSTGHPYNKDLVLDENDMGVCPACGGDPVKWIPITDGKCLGEMKEATTLHYYLAADNITTEDGIYLWIRNHNFDVCLHLNNKNMTLRGCIRAAWGCDFNVMGNGTLNFLGDNTKDEEGNESLFQVETANFTIYGGTFKSDTGKPVLSTPREGTPRITLTGDAVLSSVNVILGTVTVDGGVKIDKLEVGDCDHPNKQGEKGKLWVAKTFTGEVKSFVFPGQIADNKVPLTYGAAVAAFTGKVTTAAGVELAGAAGSLTVKAS